MGKRQYAVHRWLGAVVGAQLFLWSLGGFIFATHDIAWVRGEDGRNPAPPPALFADQLAGVAVTPAQAADNAIADLRARQAADNPDDPPDDDGAVLHVSLRPHLGRPAYEVQHRGGHTLVDAVTGAVLSPIDRDVAADIARADRAGDPAVTDVVWYEADPPGEYRGGALPAWRVDLADGQGTHIYIDASTGRITARRNDAWRRFDFFWMLHTMDYRGRDDFNHPLLIGFAALGLLSVLSGFVLWGARVYRRMRRRHRQAGASDAPADAAPSAT
jgi:uncharacterized membrane protein YkoI